MSIVYKIDILQALKDAGYNTYQLRKQKLLGEATIQALRRGELIAVKSINQICVLLNCQPGDLLEYVPDKNDAPSG